MNFEEKIENFTSEHPFWTWALARLAICICGFIIAAMAFFTLLALATPFVDISNGAGLIAFATWLWVPVNITIIWLMGSIIRIAYETFIE